jgi:uncharacterized damage-inducible protein DinB
MRRWADRIEERTLRDSIEKPKAPRTPAELINLLEDAASDLTSVADRIVEDDSLDEKFEVTYAGVPKPFVVTRGTALVHVLTHGVHHRAQCLNLLRRLGLADLPDVDAIDWEIHEAYKSCT